MISDLRFAFRQLIKSGGFAAIAIVSLALGIGLNTSMFSLMNLLIFQPFPYPDAAHLHRVYRTTPQTQTAAHSTPGFIDLQRETADFLDVAAYRMWGYTLTVPGQAPQNLNALRVSANFFSVLGIQPELGRTFSANEDQVGNHVVIISHATWQAHFGGDPDVINRTVEIDGEPTTIVGVMPQEFSSLFLWGPGDALRPLALTEEEKANHTDQSLQLIGRADRGTSIDQLNTRLTTVAARLAAIRSFRSSEDGLHAVTLKSTTTNPQTAFISWMLLALAGFVLLIVCGNLANLQLARAVARAREFAIRAALGASRNHLLRPLLAESVLLALAGGLLGVLVALWSNAWISRTISENQPISFDVALDWRVISFAFGVSLVTGVLFGIVPAWLISRVRVNETLKAGTRGTTGDRSQSWFRHTLIVGQFAAALLLLACAGYFIRALDTLAARDPHWDSSGIVQCILNLPQARYSTPEQTYAFYTQLQERLRALPGAQNAAIGWTLPIFQYLAARSYIVEGRDPPPAGHEPLAFVNGVTPSFLDTLNVKLVSGRGFASTDGPEAPDVALINRAMAEALFPGEDPIGRRIGGIDPENRGWLEIVGVFPDIEMAGNASPATTPFQVYLPLAQETWNYVTVAIRSDNPARMAEPLRRTVRELDANIPVQQLNTGNEMVALGLRGLQLISTILVGFGALGLFLSALGLYGVIARLVTQRTPEFGVRLALGAQLGDVVRLVLVSGIKLTLIGTVVGLILSVVAGQIFRAALPNAATGLDWMMLGKVTALLIAVALVSTYLPARRAARVDPLTAMRAE